MDKRYQVFVSSTYSDLQAERNKVIQTIMSLDCIPAGMELFPAIDTEQFEFIKRVIDDCDYYLLIVGGRYGSISDDGISYTEKEYDYAISRNIPVIAFLHEDISKLSLEKCDIEPDKREKLVAFRDKISRGRLVQFWNNADDLNGKVAISLMKTIKVYPAVGWVRANMQTNTESLQEINDLRKRIDVLVKEQTELRIKDDVKVNNIAKLNEVYHLSGDIYTTVYEEYDEDEQIISSWCLSITWAEIIATITPLFISGVKDECASSLISQELFRRQYPDSKDRGELSPESFFTIKVQLLALGILDESNIKNRVWVLSDKGFQIMMNERAVKTLG